MGRGKEKKKKQMVKAEKGIPCPTDVGQTTLFGTSGPGLASQVLFSGDHFCHCYLFLNGDHPLVAVVQHYKIHGSGNWPLRLKCSERQGPATLILTSSMLIEWEQW